MDGVYFFVLLSNKAQVRAGDRGEVEECQVITLFFAIEKALAGNKKIDVCMFYQTYKILKSGSHTKDGDLF